MNIDLRPTEINLSPAEAAKRIRADLKKAFPGVKFSIRSETFSQGSAVRVSYSDGPPRKAVEEIAEQFGQRGQRGFDGSDDSTYFVKGAMRLSDAGPVIVSYGGFVSVTRSFSNYVWENAHDVDWRATAAATDAAWEASK